MTVADVENSVQNETRERTARKPSVAFAFAVAGWFIPGLGQVLAGKWGRGIVFFCAVACMVLTGYFQRGFVFSNQFNEPFGLLGFVADASSGIFYLMARVFEVNGPNIARAAGDYGTRFIATGGVLNLLAVFDAYAVAIGERD